MFIQGLENESLNGVIEGCNFQKNHGVNVAFGSALAITGRSNMETPEAYETNGDNQTQNTLIIANSTFSQNLAG